MIYDRLKFPIYPIHTDEILSVDGLLWIEDQVLDDRNMKGNTLGLRRLQSPMKSIYPIKYMIQDIPSYLAHQGKFYIDNSGYFFTKEKNTRVDLKYHKIIRVDQKDIASVLWIKDCPFPFTLARPLRKDQSWAGILYRAGVPWLLYDTSAEKKKNTWRKI